MKQSIFWCAALLTVAMSPASQAQILIGQTAGFTGAVGAGVKETTDGARLYIDSINAKGGVGGQKIELICPLHGPVLRGEDMHKMLEKYTRWASYRPEKAGVVMAYASMYGNTEEVIHRLAGLLSQRGIRDIRIYDVSKTQ